MTELVAPARPLLSQEPVKRREARPWGIRRFVLFVFLSAIAEAVLIPLLLALWAYEDFDGFHAAMGLLIRLVLDIVDALPG